MGLPFLDRATRKRRDRILAVDLGSRVTKAVFLERRGEGFALTGFSIADAPIFDKAPSPELLGEHLKQVCAGLGVKSRALALAIGAGDAVVRQAEMPQMPFADMRLILKNNSKNILQQDLLGHTFDVFILLPPASQTPAGKPKIASAVGAKLKVLVAGAKQKLIDDTQAAAKNAGLHAESIFPGLLGPVNAFELALPEVFASEVVALIDIGFKQSTICVLQQGELVLSRMVSIGGDKLTSGLAESLNISYAEAEGIKVGLSSEVQAALEPLVQPLGRELRASIDFFEHERDKTVTKVFISGASARSEFIVQTLQNDLMVECKTWNPVASLQLALPPQQATEIDAAAPQLCVAIGAALSALRGKPIGLDLLAEAHDLEEMRRRDPVRLGLWGAAGLLVVMGTWAASLQFEVMHAQSGLNSIKAEVARRANEFNQISESQRRSFDAKNKLAALHFLATNRFLAGTLLNVLQRATVQDVQLLELKSDQKYIFTNKIAAWTNLFAGKQVIPEVPASVTELFELTLKAKGSSANASEQVGKLINSLDNSEYFRNALGKTGKFRLLSQPEPVPGEPSVVFSVECAFPEKTRRDPK